MFKLDLEKAEIKLPTSIGSSKKQESSRKISTSGYWLCQSLWLCEPQSTMEINERDGNTRPCDLPLVKPVCRSGSNRTGHGRADWFQIGKGVHQGCILSPCLFNLYAEYIMWNAGLDEAQAGIKISGRNINNLRYADNTTLMQENKEGLKSLKVKEESENVTLKLNIQKTKFMAPSSITSWQLDREHWKQWLTLF